MKNKVFFALQLFTELGDPAPADPAPNDPKPGDQKPSGTDPEPDTPKYTDEDVNKLIDQKFAEWQKKQQKAVDEAKKLAEMNAQQKAEYERDELKKQLADYKTRDTLSEMTRTARKMLADNHITVPDELLAMIVSDDAEATKASIEGFSQAFGEAVEKAVKERLRGETPKKGTGKTVMTKEQIMAIQDPELRQQKMLENRELFNF